MASFVTGVPDVWTSDAADDFYERFVVNEDLGAASFLEKLARSARRSAERETVLLAADLVCLCTLPVHDMGAGTKPNRVRAVLALAGSRARDRQPVVHAFTTGIASYGQGNTQIWKFMRYLAEFARAWAALDEAEREPTASPIRGHGRSFSSAFRRDGAQAAALTLVFPDVFEPIVSVTMKDAIGKSFAASRASAEEPDVDRKLVTDPLGARARPG